MATLIDTNGLKTFWNKIKDLLSKKQDIPPVRILMSKPNSYQQTINSVYINSIYYPLKEGWNYFDVGKVTRISTGRYGDKNIPIDKIIIPYYAPSNALCAFVGTNISNIEQPCWDFSNCDSMYEMFFGTSINTVDMSNWDTTNVRDIGYMFSYCSNLKALDLSDFDTRKVVCFDNPFGYCTSLTSFKVTQKFFYANLATFDLSGLTAWVDKNEIYDFVYNITIAANPPVNNLLDGMYPDITYEELNTADNPDIPDSDGTFTIVHVPESTNYVKITNVDGKCPLVTQKTIKLSSQTAKVLQDLYNTDSDVKSLINFQDTWTFTGLTLDSNSSE